MKPGDLIIVPPKTSYWSFDDKAILGWSAPKYHLGGCLIFLGEKHVAGVESNIFIKVLSSSGIAWVVESLGKYKQCIHA